MLDFPPLKGKRMKIGWDLAVGAAILIGALGLRAVDPLPLQTLRNLTFDSYQRLKPREYDPSVPVVIAAIDEKSLDKFGQWPWSRTTLATDHRSVDGARRGGDRVRRDLCGTRPHLARRPSPRTCRPIAQYDAARAQLATLPDPDAEFAAALARSPSVLAFAYSDDAALSADPSIEFPYGFSIIGHGGRELCRGQGAGQRLSPSCRCRRSCRRRMGWARCMPATRMPMA